jgi:hypothetical protein
MAYTNTIFNQLLSFLPKQHFNAFVGQHDGDKYVKKLTTWNHLGALMYAQATGKESLREIETGLSLHSNTWSHLGIQSTAKSTLSDANNRRDYQIFEKLFYELLSQCQDITPENQFSFKNQLYSLDATVIRVCLSLFDWAKYTKTKGALKMHTLLDTKTAIPQLITITDGKTADITAAKEMSLNLEKGSIVAFDRGYIDYKWWRELNDDGIFFVTRPRINTAIVVLGQHTVTEKDILSDEKISIGDHIEKYPKVLRRVRYYDRKTKREYCYLTNNITLSALQIVEVYKSRWKIEIFFKWIKQNLKIKTFFGTSQNAVMSQIWVAMIYYLLLSYIKFQTKFSKSLLELTRMIKETLLIRRNLIDLLSLTQHTIIRLKPPPQLSLWGF